MEQFSRTALLIGREGVNRLRSCRVALFGIGGVGGYVAEALIRSRKAWGLRCGTRVYQRIEE